MENNYCADETERNASSDKNICNLAYAYDVTIEKRCCVSIDKVPWQNKINTFDWKA